MFCTIQRQCTKGVSISLQNELYVPITNHSKTLFSQKKKVKSCGIGFVEQSAKTRDTEGAIKDNTTSESMKLQDPYSYGTKNFYLQSVMTLNGGINLPFGLYMEACAERYLQFVRRFRSCLLFLNCSKTSIIYYYSIQRWMPQDLILLGLN